MQEYFSLFYFPLTFLFEYDKLHVHAYLKKLTFLSNDYSRNFEKESYPIRGFKRFFASAYIIGK